MHHLTASASEFHPACAFAPASASSSPSASFVPAAVWPSGAVRYPLRAGFVYSDIFDPAMPPESPAPKNAIVEPATHCIFGADVPSASAVLSSGVSQAADISQAVSGVAFPVPPASNTGGKGQDAAIAAAVAQSFYPRGSDVVKIDTLTVSFDGSYFGGELPPVRRWLDRVSGGVLTVGGSITQHYNGYSRCFRLLLVSGEEAPFLGWLGVSDRSDNMRGRWCLHLTGEACSLLLPGAFLAIANDLDTVLHGKITRIDLAVDDLTGEHSVQDIKAMYDSGIFNIGGRNPKFQYIRSSDGDTFYVGRRGSGKMLRSYQKGRQLGDPESPWVRHETEFHAQNRVLPLDMLINPVTYFKGAYPDVFFWIDSAATRIETIRDKARIVFAAAKLFAKRQVGRFVRYCKDKLGYSMTQIVAELIADPGRYPLRLFCGLDGSDFEDEGAAVLSGFV